MGQYVEQGYQFDLTAPQVNDVLLMARNFSRPNLLHNSRLAINQRGRTFPLEGVSNDNPPSGKISIGDFLVDRWHAINTGTIYTKLNPGDNNVRIKAVTHDADGVSNNVALRQLLWTPDTNENGNTNILFDKDVTISILYQDGILFTGTGHTPRWSDFQSMAYAGENKIVGSPIVVTDNNGEKHLQLICSKNAISKNKFQVAFYLDVFGYDSEIVAAKVEIGVGQTLAIKIGNKWELIDQYNPYEDIKTCKRFYDEYIITHGVVTCENVGAQGTKELYKMNVALDSRVDMVFNPTIVGFSRASIVRADGKNCVEINNQINNTDYNDKINVVFGGKNARYTELSIVLKDSTVNSLYFETGQYKYRTYLVYMTDGTGSSGSGASQTSYGANYGPVSVTLSSEV